MDAWPVESRGRVRLCLHLAVGGRLSLKPLPPIVKVYVPSSASSLNTVTVADREPVAFGSKVTSNKNWPVLGRIVCGKVSESVRVKSSELAPERVMLSTIRDKKLSVFAITNVCVTDPLQTVWAPKSVLFPGEMDGEPSGILTFFPRISISGPDEDPPSGESPSGVSLYASMRKEDAPPMTGMILQAYSFPPGAEGPCAGRLPCIRHAAKRMARQ
jgi:hypothetical protein